MTFTKVETSIIPKSLTGKKFANKYCKRLEQERRNFNQIYYRSKKSSCHSDESINDD